MSDRRPIIDAGPALNFFSINKERLLIDAVGRLSAPETVEQEVLRKARHDHRFASATNIWKKLTPSYLEILSDDVTSELEAVVQRICELPMVERKKQAKDLGELMVVAHAVVQAETGDDVTVLIDDGNGAKTATAERRRLQRLKKHGRPVGSITIINTVTVLERAFGTEYLPDVAALRDIYGRLRGLDDGLMPIENTGLI